MNVFLPKKLRIGFQKRTGTYSGNLAYIIYYDEKNKIRKETSFNRWIDKSIEVLEIENTPQSGFVLNKNVERYNSFSSNGSKFRIYDQRGFEFEISADNFIAITTYENIISQEFSGEFIYGWEGAELVLIPLKSSVYENAKRFSEVITSGFDKKNLKEGFCYATKTEKDLLYVGKLDCFKKEYDDKQGEYVVSKSKKDIFFKNNIINYRNTNSIIEQKTFEKDTKLDFYKEVFEEITLALLNTGKKDCKTIFRKIDSKEDIDTFAKKYIKSNKTQKYIEDHIIFDFEGLLNQIFYRYESEIQYNNKLYKSLKFQIHEYKNGSIYITNKNNGSRDSMSMKKSIDFLSEIFERSGLKSKFEVKTSRFQDTVLEISKSDFIENIENIINELKNIMIQFYDLGVVNNKNLIATTKMIDYDMFSINKNTVSIREYYKKYLIFEKNSN